MVALVTSEAAPRVERALVEAGAVHVIHTVIHPVIETVIGPAA